MSTPPQHPQHPPMSDEARANLPAGCPMSKKGQAVVAESVASASKEPKDTPDKPLFGGIPCQRAKVEVKPGSADPHDAIPESTIPASGRGNSDDGKTWLNPSANQLFRALKRKDKPIDYEDALSVARVHEMVTDGSWSCVMEYENLHSRDCPNPTLARFEGKDGVYSPKARFLNLFGVNLPFDRHDWTVDRCGKEVRYIIDYYSGDDNSYSIDARPAGFSGLFDRAHLAFRKMVNGESPW
eukprot:m.74905 g.74905  ORF g.74905 m.74905 type:complete len:240 (+) comp14544_c0_seq2:133-852(+)